MSAAVLLRRLVAWSLLSLIAGCGGEGGKAPAGASTVPEPGGTAVIALQSEPDVLNPLIRTTTAAGNVLAVLYDGLTELDEHMQWQPAIATHWDVDPDGRGITYHLRPWTWEDGQPLTAADFVRSFELYGDPRVASPQRGGFLDVTGAEALDPATVRFTFARPLPDPLVRTYFTVVPAHVVDGLDPADVGAWPLNASPLASGPFRLEKWDRGRQLSLVRNERYPGRAALLDRVVFRIMPEVQTAVVALEAGEVDLVGGIPAVTARDLAARGDVRVVATGGRQLYYVQWNCRREAFAGARTRKALSLAVDRERLITSLVWGFGTPAASAVAPVCWNHAHDLAPDPLDVDRARGLLAADGWRDDDGDGVLERDGRPLAFEILTRQGDPVRENAAVILRENFRAIGADVSLRALELGAALDLLSSGSFDAYLGLVNLNVYGDAAPYLHSGSVDRFNQGRYANAEVDSLLDLVGGLRDREQARDAWLRIQRIAADDPPAAYLFYPESLVGVGPRLQDVRPHMLSPFNNLSQWWIRPQDRRYRSGS